MGEWGEWGDGIFAAAAEAGHTDILKLLIVEGCYKDQMGLKALEVAVESGSAVIVECCYSTDLGRDEDGYILNEQFVAADYSNPSSSRGDGRQRFWNGAASFEIFVGKRGMGGSSSEALCQRFRPGDHTMSGDDHVCRWAS